MFDENHAAIAGAKVIVESRGRAASLSTITDEKGEFSLSLASGEYVLTILADGFAETLQSVKLNQSENASLEVVL